MPTHDEKYRTKQPFSETICRGITPQYKAADQQYKVKATEGPINNKMHVRAKITTEGQF